MPDQKPADVQATLRRLAAQDAARTVLYTYVDRVDAGDLDATGALFRPDATYDFMGQPRRGRDEIVRRLRRALSAYDRTSRHVSNPLIEVDDAAARLSASVYAYHVRRESGAVWHFWGRYQQRLVPHDGGWAIAHMRLIGIGADPVAETQRGVFAGHPDRRPVVGPADDEPARP